MRAGRNIKIIGIIMALIGLIFGVIMLFGVTGLMSGIVQGQGIILIFLSLFFGLGAFAIGEMIEQVARIREVVDKPEELHNGTWS